MVCSHEQTLHLRTQALKVKAKLDEFPHDRLTQVKNDLRWADEVIRSGKTSSYSMVKRLLLAHEYSMEKEVESLQNAIDIATATRFKSMGVACISACVLCCVVVLCYCVERA